MYVTKSWIWKKRRKNLFAQLILLRPRAVDLSFSLVSNLIIAPTCEERFRVDRDDALFNGTFIRCIGIVYVSGSLRCPGRIYYIGGRIVDESIRENACIAISQQDDGHGRIREWSTMFFSLSLSIRPKFRKIRRVSRKLELEIPFSRLLTTKNSSQSAEHDRSITRVLAKQFDTIFSSMKYP